VDAKCTAQFDSSALAVVLDCRRRRWLPADPQSRVCQLSNPTLELYGVA
jgi:hypothetical protein